MSVINTIRGALLGAATATILTAVAIRACAQNMPAVQTNVSTASIDNFAFTPQTLTVKAGTTVTWINKDDIPHGIASEDNVFPRSKALDTDYMYSVTFGTSGTYKYFRYLHPHMTGTIVVERSNG